MPGPTFTFAFIIATLFGAGFHLAFGGDARRLALFLLAGWVGFGLGHAVAPVLGIDLAIGQLQIVTAAIGAVVALFVAHILTRQPTTRRSQR